MLLMLIWKIKSICFSHKCIMNLKVNFEVVLSFLMVSKLLTALLSLRNKELSHHCFLLSQKIMILNYSSYLKFSFLIWVNTIGRSRLRTKFLSLKWKSKFWLLTHGLENIYTVHKEYITIPFHFFLHFWQIKNCKKC